MSQNTKLQQGRVNALLNKLVCYQGRVMTKRAWVEELVRKGYTLEQNSRAKYRFDRTKFNRMGNDEQRVYERKLEERHLVWEAHNKPENTWLDLTSTEADYFRQCQGPVPCGWSHVGPTLDEMVNIVAQRLQDAKEET